MRKVMIVDDNRFIRKRLSKMLDGNGYKVIEVEDGAKAVGVYRSTYPDVTLMDVVMPQKNGLEALAEIRRFDPQAIVIMLPDQDQQSEAAKAVRLGARDVLAGPIVPDRLVSTLQKALR